MDRGVRAGRGGHARERRRRRAGSSRPAGSASGAPAGSALDVRTEHAFSIILPGDDGEEQIWNGSIDRLVVARRHGKVVWAEILDYKTDSVNEDRLAARVEFYRPQIENYARVVAAQTGLAITDISRRLVFLSAGRVVAMSRATS